MLVRIEPLEPFENVLMEQPHTWESRVTSNGRTPRNDVYRLGELVRIQYSPPALLA